MSMYADIESRLSSLRHRKEIEMSKFATWFRNALSFHHRVMAKYLRKRGWVAFYLDERYRTCKDGICWLKLYQNQTK